MTPAQLVTLYEQTESVRETARLSGLSPQKVRRVLITAGVWTSPRSDEINRLREAGKTIPEIAAALGLTENAVTGHLPYSKGAYNSDAPTENALAIRRHRGKRNTQEN